MRNSFAVTLAVLAPIGLVACGDDDSDDSGSSGGSAQTTTTQAPPPTKAEYIADGDKSCAAQTKKSK